MNRLPLLSRSAAGLAVVALLLLAPLPMLGSRPVSASPFSPTQLDSLLLQLGAEVSADSLESYLMTLQGFFTRHSVSDTVSSTVGIGAARRWVHDRFAQYGVTASYHSFTTVISSVSRQHRNVVGEITGTAPPGERRVYVLGAHLDSRNDDVNDAVGFAPGTDDDGSGVACLLECARVMAGTSWPMTIRFLAFTGEEQGLVGSEFYARDASALGEPIAGMIANDVMASIIGAAVPDTVVMSDTTKARVFALGPEESPHRQLQRYLKGMGDVYVPIQDLILIPAEDRPGRGSDHQAFTANGFTGIRFMEYLEELYRQHSADGDTLGPHLSMSYLRRQVQVDVATLGSLVRSPASPLGLTVGDIGDSTGFRLIWPSTNTEGDLAGYLVTVRTPGALDYETVVDVGLVNEFVVSSPPADSVYFGLSVRNTSDHRALLTDEVLGVLSSVPSAPGELVASSLPGAIQLDWNPGAEADLLGYHVYRSLTPGSGYVPLTGTPVATPTFLDNTAAAQTYYYYVVTAVDSSANESGVSNEDYGRRTTLDAGILFVDETKNGNNAWFPTDALADAAYFAQMGAIPFDFWEVDDRGIPELADLGMYSTVFWIADDYNTSFQGIPFVTQFLKTGIPALEEYMGIGGNVLLSGWLAAKGIGHPLTYPFDLEAGDFLYDHFGVDAVTFKQQAAFSGGVGEGFLPSVSLDPARLRGSWAGKLTRCEYLTAVRTGSDVGYRFDSADPDSAYHLQPCATYQDHGTYRTVYWGFPLYHLSDASANAALQAVITYFGEVPSTDAPVVTGTWPLALGQSRPNPFRGETTILFSVPGDREGVTLDVYDLAGRRVRRLVSGALPAGRHTVVWDGRNGRGRRVAAGVYFYRLESDGERRTRKLVHLR